MITVLDSNRTEWARMAQDAYRCGRSEIGHRYSAAAAMPNGTELADRAYDALMAPYRAWLIGGWSDVDSQREERLEAQQARAELHIARRSL